MKKIGLPDAQMYVDKESGKGFERTNYKKLLKKLKPGDILFLKSIDRLERNYNMILDKWKILTKEKNIDMLS